MARRQLGWLVTKRPGAALPWLARVRDRGKYRGRSFATEAEAKGWASGEAARLNLGIPRSMAVIAWADVVAAWMREQERRNVAVAHATECRRVAKAVAAAGLVDLADPRAGGIISRYLDGLRDRSCSPLTINRHLAIIRAAVRCGVRLGLVERDPTVAVSRVREPKALPHLFQLDDLRRLAGWVRAPDGLFIDFAPYLWCYLWCGLRSSEPAAAELIDNGAAVRVRGKGRKDRIVPVPAEARDLAPRLPLVLRDRVWVRRRLISLSEYLGIPCSDRHPHTLRHCWASLLCATGESLPVVQAWAGHESPATTARYAALAASYRVGVDDWKRGELRLLS